LITASPATTRYAEEIRAWLLGRIEKKRDSGIIPQVHERTLPPRALFWWIFEGKNYRWLEGPLCTAWMTIEQHARRLLGTHNPTWKIVDVPEGETDWLASAFASLTSYRPTFVSRASKPGLNEDEREALLGWLQWVRVKWEEYTDAVGVPIGVIGNLPWVADDALLRGVDTRRLRRWAHTAKRSRWPLLRNVVAESLRCIFEPQELDRLPLPSDHATLFEMFCMVRILGTLEPVPDHVRWLDYETNRNRVELPGLTYHFQHTLPRDNVLGTAEFDHGLRKATERHEVRVPSRADGWLVFASPHAGFHAILLEAKSGSQPFDAAIHQLKCYRAALKPQAPGRILVWGIVEQAEDIELIKDSLDQLREDASTRVHEDLWVFSSAEHIHNVLISIGLLHRSAALLDHMAAASAAETVESRFLPSDLPLLRAFP
jgi:hypothetical protein